VTNTPPGMRRYNLNLMRSVLCPGHFEHDHLEITQKSLTIGIEGCAYFFALMQLTPTSRRLEAKCSIQLSLVRSTPTAKETIVLPNYSGTFLVKNKM
jgi:hypothetical protein